MKSSFRQQKTRLEARLAIIEDHNRQLEAQLDRLRQLVQPDHQPEPLSPAATANTRFVVAAELHEGEGVAKKGEGLLVRPPSLHSSKKVESKIVRTEPINADKIVVENNKANGVVSEVAERTEDDARTGEGVAASEKRFSAQSENTEGPSNRNSLTSGSLNLSQHTLESQVLGTSRVVRRITGFHFKVSKRKN